MKSLLCLSSGLFSPSTFSIFAAFVLTTPVSLVRKFPKACWLLPAHSPQPRQAPPRSSLCARPPSASPSACSRLGIGVHGPALPLPRTTAETYNGSFRTVELRPLELQRPGRASTLRPSCFHLHLGPCERSHLSDPGHPASSWWS